jgi:hypothetical protein
MGIRVTLSRLRYTLTFRYAAAWFRVQYERAMDYFAYRKRGWKPTHYRDILTEHLVDQVKNHGLVDFHMTNLSGLPVNQERSAKAAYETLTGQRACVSMDEMNF